MTTVTGRGRYSDTCYHSCETVRSGKVFPVLAWQLRSKLVIATPRCEHHVDDAWCSQANFSIALHFCPKASARLLISWCCDHCSHVMLCNKEGWSDIQIFTSSADSAVWNSLIVELEHLTRDRRGAGVELVKSIGLERWAENDLKSFWNFQRNWSEKYMNGQSKELPCVWRTQGTWGANSSSVQLIHGPSICWHTVDIRGSCSIIWPFCDSLDDSVCGITRMRNSNMLSHRGTNSARSLVPGCFEVLGGPNRMQSLQYIWSLRGLGRPRLPDWDLESWEFVQLRWLLSKVCK